MGGVPFPFTFMRFRRRVLGSVEFKNAARLADALGIFRNTVGDLLSMLNKPVKEIERLLFEVK